MSIVGFKSMLTLSKSTFCFCCISLALMQNFRIHTYIITKDLPFGFSVKELPQSGSMRLKAEASGCLALSLSLIAFGLTHLKLL